MKLWRPRFSLRMLAIVVTVICAYVAAWEATKKYGERLPHILCMDENPNVGDVAVSNAVSPAPFILATEEWVKDEDGYTVVRRYRVWLFVITIPLPFEEHCVSGL